MVYRFKTKYFEIVDYEKPITKVIIKECLYAYNKNKRFFGKDSKFFKIYIAHTEKKFKKMTGKLYAPWVKGIGKKGKKIVIRSPKLYLKCYLKHKGTKSPRILLTHEMTHIFEFYFNIFKGPYWLTEALAMYVSGQIPGKTYKFDFKLDKKKARNLLFYRYIIKSGCMEMYTVHYKALGYLFKKFGKNKLLKLLKSYSRNMKKKDFERSFNKIYRISYNQFIKDFVNKI